MGQGARGPRPRATGICRGTARYPCRRLHQDLWMARRPTLGSRLVALSRVPPSWAFLRGGSGRRRAPGVGGGPGPPGCERLAPRQEGGSWPMIPVKSWEDKKPFCGKVSVLRDHFTPQKQAPPAWVQR